MIEKKFMTDQEMISLVVELDRAVIKETADLLAPVWDGDLDPEWIQQGVDKGFLKVTTVKKNGVAWYRYVHHKNNNGYLNVNASCYVGPVNGSDKWLWLIGADFIARQNGCRGIIMTSRREGHIEQCHRGGFKVIGVTMSRSLEGLAAQFPAVRIKETNGI